ncbi:MAG: hypothetical protein KAW09_03630, partial [Thermoplasmata archaeon]|nr:hypothetical protein [Thermoplasmata archaeon]
MDANVDIIDSDVRFRGNSLCFGLRVGGSSILEGNPVTRGLDIVGVFIDSDQDFATGYQVEGIGADHMIQVAGFDGEVVTSQLFQYLSNGVVGDWNNWNSVSKASASVSGDSLEAAVHSKSLESKKSDVDALFYTKSWNGQGDVADYVQSSQYGLLAVSQRNAFDSDFVMDQSDQAVLHLDLASVRGNANVDSIEVESVGTAPPSEVSMIRIKNADGETISESMLNGGSATLSLNPLIVHKGETVALTIHADATGNSGKTFGLKITHSRAIASPNSGVALNNLPTTNGLGYVGVIAPGLTIDGAFLDWQGMLETDEISEQSTNGNRNIDM